MFRVLLSAAALIFLQTATADTNISREDVVSDLAYLRTSLEETHFNLYAVTPEKDFEANYQAVTSGVTKESYSELEAISLFQQVISAANTGHAEIDFPVGAYRKYAMAGGSLFPLDLIEENDKVVVKANFSENPAFAVGTEILSINGQSITDILNQIDRQLSAETPYFKNAKREIWSFPRLYWQVFGKVDAFQIEISTKDGAQTIISPAINLIEGFERKRSDVFSDKRGLSFIEEIAYLNPGNFSGDLDAFKTFVDASFADIASQSATGLIVDLRNNSGGDNDFSDYLVSYFADQPFKWSSNFQIKVSDILLKDIETRNLTSAYFQTIQKHKAGETFEFPLPEIAPQPKDKRFTGDVILLVNRHSYSMAAVTAAMVQDYGFATIIGETTGDHPTLHASQFSYTLPKTGVVVKSAKGYMIRPNGSEDFAGLVPNVPVAVSVTDENDPILDRALAELKQN